MLYVFQTFSPGHRLTPGVIREGAVEAGGGLSEARLGARPHGGTAAQDPRPQPEAQQHDNRKSAAANTSEVPKLPLSTEYRGAPREAWSWAPSAGILSGMQRMYPSAVLNTAPTIVPM